MRQGRRPNGSPENKVRSVRCSAETWDAAVARAADEGVTMSHVMLTFIEGYAQGKVSLPDITMTYAPRILVRRYTEEELLARRRELENIRETVQRYNLDQIAAELEDIEFLLDRQVPRSNMNA